MSEAERIGQELAQCIRVMEDNREPEPYTLRQAVRDAWRKLRGKSSRL